MSFRRRAFWNNVVVSGGVGTGIYTGARIDPYQTALLTLDAPDQLLAIISLLSAIATFFLVVYAWELARFLGVIGIAFGYGTGYFLGAGNAETGIIFLMFAVAWTQLAAAWAEEQGY